MGAFLQREGEASGADLCWPVGLLKSLFDEANHSNFTPKAPHERDANRMVFSSPTDAGVVRQLSDWSARIPVSTPNSPPGEARQCLSYLQGTARCGAPKMEARYSGVTPSEVVGGLIVVSTLCRLQTP